MVPLLPLPFFIVVVAAAHENWWAGINKPTRGLWAKTNYPTLTRSGKKVLCFLWLSCLGILPWPPSWRGQVRGQLRHREVRYHHHWRGLYGRRWHIPYDPWHLGETGPQTPCDHRWGRMSAAPLQTVNGRTIQTTSILKNRRLREVSQIQSLYQQFRCTDKA